MSSCGPILALNSRLIDLAAKWEPVREGDFQRLLTAGTFAYH